MENQHVVEKIKECTQNILTCKEDFLIMKQSVDRLYAIFSGMTGITGDNFKNEQIMLPSGKAISPSGAAHCLLEFRRTAIFFRGIDKAIQQKLTEKQGAPIHILYAGTGPFATLLLPLVPLYSPEEITVDLLDINQISLNAARELFDQLGLGQFVGKSYASDATIFVAEKPYDIVISETMQAALKKEPQVAVMQNLIPQMPADVIFIPESISVNAQVVSNGHWDNEKMVITGVEIFAEKELFTVSKDNLDASAYHNELVLPGAVGNCHNLILNTIVSVYKDEALKDNDCSLTMPLKVCDLDTAQTGNIRFWYEQGNFPGIRCQVTQSEKVFEAIGRKFHDELYPNQFSKLK